MTRDEQRAACIEEMATAMFDCYRGYNDETQKMMWLREKYGLTLKAERAFDSLHGLARVCPVEATEEMVDKASISEPYRHFSSWAFKAMAAIGDLTNPPEKKT